MTHSTTTGPDQRALFALFPGDGQPEYEFVSADEVPPPYHGLLVHEHHMTVTVEDFHGEPVDVTVLAKNCIGDSYARKILLLTRNTRRVVQFGIVRIDFRFTSPEVRTAIEAEDTPLGRVLIEHNVLRRIEPTRFLRVLPGPATVAWFGLDQPRLTYGRLAYIHCDNQPAVELLEIVAPAYSR